MVLVADLILVSSPNGCWEHVCVSSLFACLMQECQDPPKGLAMKAHRIGSKDPPTRWSSYRTSGPSPVRMKHGAAPPRRSKRTDGTMREPDPDSLPDPEREPVRRCDRFPRGSSFQNPDTTRLGLPVWTADQLTPFQPPLAVSRQSELAVPWVVSGEEKKKENNRLRLVVVSGPAQLVVFTQLQSTLTFFPHEHTDRTSTPGCC